MLKMRELYVGLSTFVVLMAIQAVHADQMAASLNAVDQSWNQEDQIVFRSYKINDALADLLIQFL
jgi:hypothetical protein